MRSVELLIHSAGAIEVALAHVDAAYCTELARNVNLAQLIYAQRMLGTNWFSFFRARMQAESK